MKKLFLCAAVLLLAVAAQADDDNTDQPPVVSGKDDTPYFVNTTWGPGIQMRLVGLHRILDNRLLAVFRVEATREAPASGVLIGGTTTQPAGLPKKTRFVSDITAFHVSNAVMVDDLSQAKYPQLPPVAPPGRVFNPPACAGVIIPGRSLQFTLQFAVPPPPPPPKPGQPPPIETLSFIVPTATGPISKAPIPPPLPAPAPPRTSG